MTPKRLYAIGLRGWVQIRRSAKRPVERMSVGVITVKGNPFTLRQVRFVGGHVVETLSARSFAQKARIHINPDQCLVIPKANPYARKKEALCQSLST